MKLLLAEAPYGALGTKAVWTIVPVIEVQAVVTDGRDEIVPWDRDLHGSVTTVLVKTGEKVNG